MPRVTVSLFDIINGISGVKQQFVNMLDKVNYLKLEKDYKSTYNHWNKINFNEHVIEHSTR